MWLFELKAFIEKYIPLSNGFRMRLSNKLPRNKFVQTNLSLYHQIYLTLYNYHQIYLNNRNRTKERGSMEKRTAADTPIRE